MKEKELQIIRYLLKSKEWTTANNLSQGIQVSVRTVKTYIADLNHSYPGLIHSSVNGYCIDKAKARSLLSTEKKDGSFVPQTNKERTFFTILTLLRASDPLNIYDLADQMFISVSTLRQVLKRVKKHLSLFQLKLKTSGDTLSIMGSEQNRSQMLRSLIFQETSMTLLDLDALQNIFTNINVTNVLNLIHETFWENRFYATDFSVFNILLHIVIIIDRNLSKNQKGIEIDSEKYSENPLDMIPENVHHMTQSFIQQLRSAFSVQFSEDDFAEIVLLFYSRATSFRLHNMDEDSLEQYIGNDCMALITKLHQQLREEYGIDMDLPEPRVSFALHIKSLTIRSKTRHFSRNPLTESIKTTCPMVYDVAVSLCRTIEDKLGTSLIDDEIAYIALHIGSAIELQKAIESRLSVVIICPTYYNIHTNLNKNLKERFGNDILINDITISENKLVQYNDFDFVLSTVPMDIECSKPVLLIQPFLTNTDIHNIENLITQIKKEKKKDHFLREFRTLTFPEFYIHMNKTLSKKEIIHFICKKLLAAGYATDGLEDAIFEREKLSSTSFSNFAIPHTISMQENKSCLFILINDQPVPWGNNEVQLVILICFASKDRDRFYSVFEPLSGYLLNPHVIQQILKSTCYEEFLRIISGLVLTN